MDVYEGDAIVVASIRYDANVTYEDMGELSDALDESEYEKFVEWIFAYEDISEDDEKEYFEENFTWENFSEFNPDRFKELEEESWQANVDYYGYEEIDQKLFECVQQLEALL